MSGQQFRITNTTAKPLKTNARGEDIRSIQDRNGYGVQVVLPNKNPPEYHTLYRPGQSVTVDSLTEEISRMQKKGRIKIEALDIGAVLKSYTEAPAQEEATPLTVEENLSEYNAKSYPMGESRGEDKLVNPDGDPNFVMTAPKGGMKRVRKPENQ